jgi:hypothetical protein
MKSLGVLLAGNVTRMGETKNGYGILVVKPLGKLPLERPRNKEEDSTMICFREMEVDGTGSESFPILDFVLAV